MLALEPFEPYDASRADELLDILDELPRSVIAAVETSTPMDAGVLLWLDDAASWWAAREVDLDEGMSLSRAFALPSSPTDVNGHFRPELVLQHYAHRAGDLLAELIPHLVSLGVPHVTDVLAGVFIVGQVLDCDDPVAAYVAANMLINRFLAADPAVAEQTRDHLKEREAALQRTQQAARRAHDTVRAQSDDTEARAYALADAYKRTVEGPFRQFSWSLHCLRVGKWSEPPMLTSLRERLIAEGGTLAAIARDVVLPDMRNSETHETLAWDGFTEQFVTESGRVDAIQVAAALSMGTAFVHGSEAGLAAIRALFVRADVGILPSVDEEGRMPTWDRVRAFFGTNRLILVEARLNSPHARFRVQRIGQVDINPCFQALLLARRLLPRTERFEVSTAGSDGPLIVVDAEALDATMPAWDFAVSNLDQMPLSTFLAANLDARRRVETESAAMRSVAWIAADDALGVIDGSPEAWNDDVRRLIDIRLQVVEIAVSETRQRMVLHSPRLESVQGSVASLRSWIARKAPSSPWQADEHPALVRLRAQWNKWGPVLRHPSITEVPLMDISQAQPQLRSAPESMHYRTL